MIASEQSCTISHVARLPSIYHWVGDYSDVRLPLTREAHALVGKTSTNDKLRGVLV